VRRRDLLCALPSGAQTAAEDRASAVEVVIREFEFEPRPLKVKAGTVRFMLTNRGSVDHDLIDPAR